MRSFYLPFICLHHNNWWFCKIKRWYTFLKYKTASGFFWEFFSDVNLPTTGQRLSLGNLIWKYYVPFLLVFMTDNFSFVLRNNNQTPRWRGRRVPCFRHLGHRGKGKYPWSIHKPDYSQLSPCEHSAITDTLVIRTAAKSQCKNKLQIFGWNKLPLMRTLNRVPTVRCKESWPSHDPPFCL